MRIHEVALYSVMENIIKIRFFKSLQHHYLLVHDETACAQMTFPHDLNGAVKCQSNSKVTGQEFLLTGSRI